MRDALEQLRTFWFVITIMAGTVCGYVWILNHFPSKHDVDTLRMEVQRFAAQAYADRFRAIEIHAQYLREKAQNGHAMEEDKLALRQWEAELRVMKDSWAQHAIEFSTPLQEVE